MPHCNNVPQRVSIGDTHIKHCGHGEIYRLNTRIRKEENSHVSSLLKNVENEEHNKCRARREGIIKVGSEISEIENKMESISHRKMSEAKVFPFKR